MTLRESLLRPPGVPGMGAGMGAGEKRGLTILTGLLGLDMVVEFENRSSKNAGCQPETDG